MKHSMRFCPAGIGALALLSTVLLIRQRPLSFDPISAYLLGVAPNFAAAVATIFVLLSISTDHKRNAELSAIRYRFFIFAAVSGIGLIGWELFQETSKRLVFDPYDLFATLVRNWHSHAPVFRDYSSNV